MTMDQDNRVPNEDDAADGRSATAKAAEWTSRIITISLEMVLPGLAGYWLDTQLGTRALFLLLGFAVGGYLAFMQLKAIAQTTQKAKSTKNRPAKNQKKTK
jgi:hypothetical protein